MRFRVAVTNNDWFDFLSNLLPDEVNFWQPGGGRGFGALAPGEPLLFKLHSPLNFIAGGGFFVRHSRIPISLAWEAFGKKNGFATFEQFLSTIQGHIGNNDGDNDPIIGCLILAGPFFFNRDEWIPVPENWHRNIVQGRNYDTKEQIGARLWKDVEERLEHQQVTETQPMAAEEDAAYGSEYLARARLGQGTFRVLVTEAYDRRCAITGGRTLPVLEAAHIKPYAMTGPNKVSNGLLLRSDLHKLFDLGYLTITTGYNVEVSNRIKEEYHNGKEYYKLHGSALKVFPCEDNERPSPDLLDWHNQNIFMP